MSLFAQDFFHATLGPMTEEEKYRKCVADIGLLLLNTSCLFQIIERDQRRSTGFTSSQAFLISLLLEKESINNEEICRIMSLEKSSVSRMVKILVRDNILAKNRAKGDKRVFEISLTAKGKQTAQDIFNVRKDYYSEIITCLPRGHVREVMQGAQTMYDALDSALKKHRPE
ncbi:MAG: MarR family transcriptional regulator [Spirochaetales bacterium]|nr:MarR family transcriptional regulator [Spirochaetales bacterium]